MPKQPDDDAYSRFIACVQQAAKHARVDEPKSPLRTAAHTTALDRANGVGA